MPGPLQARAAPRTPRAQGQSPRPGSHLQGHPAPHGALDPGSRKPGTSTRLWGGLENPRTAGVPSAAVYRPPSDGGRAEREKSFGHKGRGRDRDGSENGAGKDLSKCPSDFWVHRNVNGPPAGCGERSTERVQRASGAGDRRGSASKRLFESFRPWSTRTADMNLAGKGSEATTSNPI